MAFDLLVLDVMMPGETGLELAASLRRTSRVPILMLTARAEPEDRIEGLEIGVDDYLAKPFEPKELLLRMENILRRSGRAAPPSEIAIGDSVFQIDKGELRRGSDQVKLTSRERDLLRQLAQAPGRTFARDELAQSGDGGTRSVDVQVNRLRRKLEPDPRHPVHLLTIRGAGYALFCD
jgi:two-component system phosphate regulon response regulator OmpR